MAVISPVYHPREPTDVGLSVRSPSFMTHEDTHEVNKGGHGVKSPINRLWTILDSLYQTERPLE